MLVLPATILSTRVSHFCRQHRTTHRLATYCFPRGAPASDSYVRVCVFQFITVDLPHGYTVRSASLQFSNDMPRKRAAAPSEVRVDVKLEPKKPARERQPGKPKFVENQPSTKYEQRVLTPRVGPDNPRRMAMAAGQRRARPQSVTVPNQPSAVFGRLMADEAQAKLSQSSYLTGFVDPLNAARGPQGQDYRPTILITLTARNPITIQNGSSSFWVGSAGVGILPADSAGNVAIVVTPHILELAGGACLFGTGFSYDVGRAIDGGSVYAASVQPYSFPLGTFGDPLPGFDLTSLTNASAGADYEFRTVGLRATITNTTAELTAQGIAMAGDNGDLFQAAERMQFTSFAQGGSAVPSFDSLAPKEFQAATSFGSFDRYTRVNNVGAFANGDVIEAVWLPTNDRALDYDNDVPALPYSGSANAASNQHALNVLSNGPGLLFGLYGMPNGATAFVDVVWVVEATVRSGTTLGWLKAEARLNASFVVAWSHLACVTPGGKEGEPVRLWAKCANGAAGIAMVKDGKMQPSLRRPINMGPAPMSAIAKFVEGIKGTYVKLRAPVKAAAAVGAMFAPELAAVAAAL
jgi:hypothetical protein